MTTYTSKIGPELAIPVFVLLGSTGLLMSYEKIWSGLLVIVLVSLFIGHMFLTTYYQIDGQNLRIRCGFLVNQSIDITTIRTITETRNPMSSPAISIDRLEIAYNKFDSVLVSPRDKTGFIQALKAVKAGIDVTPKKGNNR
ncbi:PH domain-containing protein [Spirosoma aerophilum]